MVVVTIILHRNRHRSPLVNLVHSLMNWVIPRARSTNVTIILHRSHHRSLLINLVHSLINRVVPRARSAEHGARSTRKREQIDWMILSILIRIYVRDPDQNLRSSSPPSKLRVPPTSVCADDDDATPESEPEPAAGAERATASRQWPSLECFTRFFTP